MSLLSTLAPRVLHPHLDVPGSPALKAESETLIDRVRKRPTLQRRLLQGVVVITVLCIVSLVLVIAATLTTAYPLSVGTRAAVSLASYVKATDSRLALQTIRPIDHLPHSPSLGVFDKIFVIHLQGRLERKTRMESLQDALELDFHYVQAIQSQEDIVTKILKHVRHQRVKEGWLKGGKGGSVLSESLASEVAVKRVRSSSQKDDLNALRASAAQQPILLAAINAGWRPHSLFSADAFALLQHPFRVPIGTTGSELWTPAVDGLPRQGGPNVTNSHRWKAPDNNTGIPCVLGLDQVKSRWIVNRHSDEEMASRISGKPIPTLDASGSISSPSEDSGLDATSSDGENTATIPWYQTLSRGMVACWLSHVGVLRQIVEGELRSALILEDDVDMEWDVEERLVGMWGSLPKDGWDIVYLGT